LNVLKNSHSSTIKTRSMLLQNLKIAIRVLTRHKGYTLINLAGITVGVTVCLLIGLYVQHELSYDRYHINHQNIYRLANKVDGASYENGIAKVSAPWGPGLAQNLPEIKSMCRFVFFGETLFKNGDKEFYEPDGFYADSTVLDLFSWNLIAGDPKTAMDAPNKMIITESFAKKYFGNENPLGKTFTVDNTDLYKVTGLIKDVPSNSHFRFNFLVSLSTYHHPDMIKWNRWNQFYTYLLLKPGASIPAVEQKANAFLDEHLDSATAVASTPFLQPLTSIHLHSDLFREIEANSSSSYVYIFGTLALFIILIACLNFVNLSTAQAIKRSAEVGIRKVNGASRISLLWQFLSETILICIASIILAIGLAWVVLPYLNNFLEKQIPFNWLTGKWLLGGIIALFVFISLVSGLYPAVVLASFNPVKIIGRRSSAMFSGSLLRKALVVCQFSISIIMIIAALVTGMQLNYINNKKLGFNKEQILIIPLRDQETIRRFEIVKQELSQVPGVISVSASANRPGGSDFGIPYEIEGLPQDNLPPMRLLVVDQDFLKTYQMEIASGRGFQKELSTDTNAYLINEEAARQLGLKNPVGSLMKMPAIYRGPAPIIGVVKDFHFRSLHEKIAPLFFIIETTFFTELAVRIRTTETEKTIEGLRKKWAGIEPQNPFTYNFFDEGFNRLYISETRTASIVRIFSILAIFIACLGLLGLATHSTQQRVKEIGIRKVLGAKVSGIVFLLSFEFLKLVFLAAIIAFPVAWWAMNNWLKDFAYRVNIEWWVFVVGGGSALVITLLTVLSKAISAAIANPVKSLRTE